jgi:hypothetical protein
VALVGGLGLGCLRGVGVTTRHAHGPWGSPPCSDRLPQILASTASWGGFVLEGVRVAEAFRRGRLRAGETPKALLCASFAEACSAASSGEVAEWTGAWVRTELLACGPSCSRAGRAARAWAELLACGPSRSHAGRAARAWAELLACGPVRQPPRSRPNEPLLRLQRRSPMRKAGTKGPFGSPPRAVCRGGKLRRPTHPRARTRPKKRWRPEFEATCLSTGETQKARPRPRRPPRAPQTTKRAPSPRAPSKRAPSPSPSSPVTCARGSAAPSAPRTLRSSASPGGSRSAAPYPAPPRPRSATKSPRSKTAR